MLTTAPSWKSDGLPKIPASVRVHRVTGGPLAGAMAMLARREERKQRKDGGLAGTTRSQEGAADVCAGGMQKPVQVPAAAAPMGATRLNWKGKLAERLKRMATGLLFPDTRGEWYFPARRAMDQLVARNRPDIVVSSHEPPMSLELGIVLKRRHRLPWLVDLGDPVLADYTPRRWHRRAFRVERRVMRMADGITVTTPGTRQLLIERHGAPSGRVGIQVLTQGFDDQAREPDVSCEGTFEDGLLELLYTGSFYRFRRPDALIDAVIAVPGVRLSVAAAAIPDWLGPRFDAHPQRFRLLGFLPHAAVLDLQERCDVLVNIANDNPCQVPGKFFEYLGASRPILHMGGSAGDDLAAEIIRDRRRGWVCGDDDALAALLRTLVESKRSGEVNPGGMDMGRGAVAEFGWSRQAQKLSALMETLVRPGCVEAVQHVEQER